MHHLLKINPKIPFTLDVNSTIHHRTGHSPPGQEVAMISLPSRETIITLIWVYNFLVKTVKHTRVYQIIILFPLFDNYFWSQLLEYKFGIWVRFYFCIDHTFEEVFPPDWHTRRPQVSVSKLNLTYVDWILIGCRMAWGQKSPRVQVRKHEHRDLEQLHSAHLCGDISRQLNSSS